MGWVEEYKMSMKVEDKLFLDRFRVDEESHLRIIDGAMCMEKCIEQPCLYICPANVYRLEKNRISVAYEGCLECGSCRIGCPHLNIEWRFPRGGYGISHKFG
jgi:ferredoxin like protein